MRKTAGKSKFSRAVHCLDTVGVAGSIPVEPTILKIPRDSQVLVIPDEYEVIPGVTYDGGRPRFFRCLVKKSPKTCEKLVNRAAPRRRSKRSA